MQHDTDRWSFLRDERAEGVISTAIAVLIMAFIGAGMWVAFNAVFTDASTTIGDCVDVIGSDAGAEC